MKYEGAALQDVRNKALGKLSAFSWLVYLSHDSVDRSLGPLRIRGEARLNVSPERIARQSVHMSYA